MTRLSSSLVTDYGATTDSPNEPILPFARADEHQEAGDLFTDLMAYVKDYPEEKTSDLTPKPSKKTPRETQYLDLMYWAMCIQENIMQVGLCVDFRYEDRGLEKITVAFPIPGSFIPKRNAARAKAEEAPCLQHQNIAAGELWGSFFATAPTFHGVLQSAKTSNQGDYERERLYNQALLLAKNTKQRVVVLEELINESYHAYYKCDGREIRRWGGDSFVERETEKCLTEINTYVKQLPENYQNLTPTTQEVETSIQGIFEKLQAGQIGPAYLSYRKMSRLSPFVMNHIPYLGVMQQLLSAFFSLIDTQGYTLSHYYSGEPHSGEPRDEEFREKKLLLYLHHGAIWYGTKMSSGEIKRFFIPDSALGVEAKGIRDKLGLSISLEHDEVYAQERVLFDVVAKNGFYESNYTSLEKALEYFNQAALFVKAELEDEDPRAIFLRKCAIEPLQRLINSARPTHDKASRDFRNQRIQERRATLAKLVEAPQCPWETFEQMKNKRERRGQFINRSFLLKPLSLPQGPHALFAALALSMLLPVLEDEDAFEDAFELLFDDGTTSTREKRRLLRRELRQLTRESIPDSLPALIQEDLLPKLQSYYKEQPPRAESKHEEINELEDLQDELKALSVITGVVIRLHDDVPILLAHKPLTADPAEQGIHLLYSKGQVQALIEIALLSPDLRNQLFPIQTAQQEEFSRVASP